MLCVLQMTVSNLSLNVEAFVKLFSLLCKNLLTPCVSIKT